MNRHQLAKLVLVLSCIASDVLAGVLPGGGVGGGGYQYNRPSGGGGFVGGGGGGFVSGDTGFGHGGGDFGVGGYRGRPTQAYGPPGAGDAFGRQGGGLGGQSTYRHPQFGGSGGHQGGAGGGYQGGAGGGYQGGAGGGYQGGAGGGYQGGAGGGYQGGAGGGFGGYGGRDGGRPQPYSFQYEVVDPPSGNDYSRRESSDGNVVQGEYRVLLPDSRTQIVRYMADDVNGYNADVQYEGQAQYSRGGGPGGYQGGGFGGRGGYGGSGGFGTSGFGDGDSNQYLPPHHAYHK